MLDTPRHHLLFCQQYPTGACVIGNDGVRSLRDNAASPSGGNLIARNGCDYQHRGGRELGLSGMVNRCELP
jgi:hypothetical protein